MRIPLYVRDMCAATTIVALLSACAGGGSPIAPARDSSDGPTGISQDGLIQSLKALHRSMIPGRRVATPSFFDPDAKGKPLIFGADGFSVVYIYLQADKKQKMVGEITGLTYPSGLATDTRGNLYVAGNDTVPVYAPPYTSAPKLTLDDPGYYSEGVALSPTGVIALTNFCNAPSCSSDSGNVVFYARNSTTPCVTLSDPNFASPLFDAFDDRGNLYITGISGGGGHFVGEIKGGCSAKKILVLTTTNDIGAVGGIQVEANRIAILGKGGSTYDVLDVYKMPKKRSLGNPISVTDLVTPALPIDIAFSASRKDVYSAEEEASGGLINSYDFPAGGLAENSITFSTGTGFGVAATPPLLP